MAKDSASDRAKPKQRVVVVDGGHFTPREVDPSFRTTRATPFILIEAARQTAISEAEVFRVEKSETDVWIVWRWETHSAEAVQSLGAKSVAFLSGPSATETQTFREAATFYAARKAEGVHTILRLMVGDFGIPAPLRRHLEWAVPQDYRLILAEFGVVELEVISEAHCRNQGLRKTRERFKSLLDKRGHYGDAYAKHGYGVVEVVHANTPELFLLSDNLYQRRVFLPVVTLTQHRTHATCAALVAGCLLELASRGVSEYVSFYDLSDDREIREKLVDGATIAGYLSDRPQMECVMNTSFKGKPSALDIVRFKDLKRSGLRKSFQSLVDDTRAKMRGILPHWMSE